MYLVEQDRTLILASLWLAVVLSFVAAVPGQKADQALERCWVHSGSVSAAAGLTVDEDNVFVVDERGMLLALDRSTGSVNWRSELGGRIETKLAVSGKAVYVVSRSDGNDRPSATFRSVSTVTGITIWSAELPYADRYSIHPVNGMVIVTGSDGSVLALDAAAGAARWRRNVQPGTFAYPFVNDASITLQADQNTLVSLSTDGGRTVRTTPLPKAGPSHIAAADGDLVFADSGGSLRSGESSNGWEYKTGGAISQLVSAGDNILAASADNFIYSVSASSGNVEWKRRMPGRVASLNLLSENRAAIIVIGEATVFVVNLEDGRFVDQFTVGPGQELVGTTVAGDENFVVVLTSSGAAGFGRGCGKGKSGETGRRF